MMDVSSDFKIQFSGWTIVTSLVALWWLGIISWLTF